MFSELKICLVRVWRPSTAILYLNGVAKVFLTRGTRTHGQDLRTQVHVCVSIKEGRAEFLFLLGV